jgi:putative endonuclease
MFFVYFLQTAAVPRHYYRGYTAHQDPHQRLWEHNQNQCKSTAGQGPWELVSYVAFTHQQSALSFEKYTKQGTGHAFTNKHFYQRPSVQKSFQNKT